MTRAAAVASSVGVAGSVYVVFDGQSHNLSPATPYPTRLMKGRGIRWANVAISGYSWDDLTDGINPGEAAADRLHPLANLAETTILVMCGGTQNINEGDSAATYFGKEETYASAARAAGFSHVINTTLLPSSTFTQTAGAENDQRIAANVLKLASVGGGIFDACADLAADASLSDLVWANPPSAATWSSASGSYFDGTHLSSAGAVRAAAIVDAELTPLLP